MKSQFEKNSRFQATYLSEGEVPVAVGVELLEELPALLLGLVRPLEGQLLVDGRPVHVAHLAAAVVVWGWASMRLLYARGRRRLLGVSVLGRH